MANSHTMCQFYVQDALIPIRQRFPQVRLIHYAVQNAQDFHAQFHVTAETLRKHFNITRQQARDIVTQCRNCCQFLPIKNTGVNPRGIQPLQLWQMDVTHISSFGKQQFVHVSVDTCSGVIHASPLTGEKTIHAIQHCLEAWSTWENHFCLRLITGQPIPLQNLDNFVHK